MPYAHNSLCRLGETLSIAGGMDEWMVNTQLSDAELLRLMQEDGEMSDPVLQELKQRHLRDVRAFAGFVCPSEGDALAIQAWNQAMQLQMQDLDGAVRPRALSAVVRTAAGWAGTGQRSVLKPEFVAWFHAQGSPDPAGTAPAARASYFGAVSTMARAFDILPGRSQVVVWHRQVERDDSEVLERLLGEGPEAVSQLIKRSMQDLFNSYIQIHQDSMVDETCSRYHRMLMAFVERKSRNTTRDFVSHLEKCAHCASAVNDLRRKPSEFGPLLAEALLPWGGPGYAVASREAAAAKAAEAKAVAEARAVEARAEADQMQAAAQLDAAQPTANLPAVAAPPVAPVPVAQAPVAPAPVAPALHTIAPGAEGRETTAAQQPTGAGRRADRRKPQATASLEPGPSAGRADGTGRRESGTSRSLMTVLLVVVALFVIGAAYVGGLLLRSAEIGSSQSPQGTSPSETAGQKPGEPPSSRKPGSETPARPHVKNAALEWLFDDVDDDKTPDTSGSGLGGRLDGDPPAKSVKDGLLEFDGAQAVISDGPVVDTTESFSVSARVKPAKSDEDALTVASQYAQNASGFSIEYLPETKQWEMSMPRKDAVDADRNRVISEIRTEPGEWVHVTGVYDDTLSELRIYIDGKLEARDKTVFQEDVEADGDFAVARGTSDESRDRTLEGFFEGTIDDVRVFNRALSLDEAKRLS
jgi:hypothetical protein